MSELIGYVTPESSLRDDDYDDDDDEAAEEEEEGGGRRRGRRSPGPFWKTRVRECVKEVPESDRNWGATFCSRVGDGPRIPGLRWSSLPIAGVRGEVVCCMHALEL